MSQTKVQAAAIAGLGNAATQNVTDIVHVGDIKFTARSSAHNNTQPTFILNACIFAGV